MPTVDYPPGAVVPIHRHDAHAFVHVLEGTICSWITSYCRGLTEFRTSAEALRLRYCWYTLE